MDRLDAVDPEEARAARVAPWKCWPPARMRWNLPTSSRAAPSSDAHTASHSRVRTSMSCFLNTFTSWPQLSRFLCTDEAFLSKECIETSEG